MDGKHSPLPWRSGNLVTNDGGKAVMSEGGRVATFDSPDPIDQHPRSDSEGRDANIALTLTAVNHHQELVDMVEDLSKVNESGNMPVVVPHLESQAKALLARIKEASCD